MITRFCDRCGERVFELEIGYPKFEITQYYRTDGNSINTNDIDLCSKCVDELDLWFYSKRKGGVNDDNQGAGRRV